MTTTKDALPELLPCPFCGSEAVSHHAVEDREFVMCGNCGADIDSINADGDVRAAWNRRAALASKQAPSLTPVIQWLENGCDPKEAAKELRLYQEAAEAQAKSEPAALTDAQLDALMPEPDGEAETNKTVVFVGGMYGYDFDMADAWSRDLVRTSMRAAIAATQGGGTKA